MNNVAEVVNALAGLAWPLIAGLVLWRLFPSIKKIAESRGFTVKVGQAELTVQEVSEKLLATTADIQGTLASVAPISRIETADATSQRKLARVLWVDDSPSNNAYEVAQLQTLGVDAAQATSTSEALSAISRTSIPFNAVISDLGRVESSGFNSDAGIELIRQIRAQGLEVPVFIYSSRRAIARTKEIIASGGNGVTASPTELFAQLRTVGSFPRTTGQ